MVLLGEWLLELIPFEHLKHQYPLTLRHSIASWKTWIHNHCVSRQVGSDVRWQELPCAVSKHLVVAWNLASEGTRPHVNMSLVAKYGVAVRWGVKCRWYSILVWFLKWDIKNVSACSYKSNQDRWFSRFLAV